MSLSARRAAAQAHSSVRRVRGFLPKSTYSREGGLVGDTSGEEGMLSHMAPLGLRREGVRAAGDRSSDRDAMRSRERRAVHVVEPLLLLRGGGEEDGTARLALLAAAAVDAATLRSVCLLFWNQIVTDLISLGKWVDAVSG